MRAVCPLLVRAHLIGFPPMLYPIIGRIIRRLCHWLPRRKPCTVYTTVRACVNLKSGMRFIRRWARLCGA